MCRVIMARLPPAFEINGGGDTAASASFFGAHIERSCDTKVSITVFIRDLKNIFLIRLVPYLISSA